MAEIQAIAGGIDFMLEKVDYTGADATGVTVRASGLDCECVPHVIYRCRSLCPGSQAPRSSDCCWLSV